MHPPPWERRAPAPYTDHGTGEHAARPREAAAEKSGAHVCSGRVAFQGHIHLCSTVSASIHAVLHGRLVWRPRARVTQRRAMRRARPAHLHDVSINMANLGQGWHRPRAVGTAREADLLVRSRSLRWSRARVRLPDPHPDATPSSTLLSCPAHSQGHSKHITRPTGGRASLSLSLSLTLPSSSHPGARAPRACPQVHGAPCGRPTTTLPPRRVLRGT
jgi:hypothetical protein